MNLQPTPVENRASDFKRRIGHDRRQEKTPLFSRYSVKGRRIALRREDDRLKRFVPDRHSSKTFAIILVIVMLSIVDAILTLELISKGASELNPVMAYYLDFGPLAFFWTKYLLTFASTLLILFHQEAYLFRSKVQAKVLYLFLMAPFVLVVYWELHLLHVLDGVHP
jgi:hypothetical protein